MPWGESLNLLRKRELRLLIPADELDETRVIFRRKISYRDTC